MYSLNNQLYFSYSLIFHLFWGFTNFCVFPFTFMTLSLWVFHFLGAMCNVTTIENMKGISFNFFSFATDHIPKYTNVYDKGFISNLIHFFNSSYLFIFPQEVNNFNDGN